MITRVLGSTDLAVSETVGAIAEMLELRRFGLSPGGPQQCLVFVEVDGPPGPATRAGLPQGSASAFRAEDGVVGAGERACQPVGADDRARRLLDVDVVESESARHGGAERDRFAERLVSGLDKLGPSLPGAVGQVGQHLERCVDTIARIQRSNGGFESKTSAGLDTVGEWQRAGQARDLEAAVACLAEEVVVISPLTAQFRFEGRAQVAEMLRAAFAVIDSINYHTTVGDADTRALFYFGRCGGQDFEEAQLVRLNTEGLIAELTFFGRPLPGLTAVMARIGPEMLKDKRPGLARVVSAATRPLATMTRLAESRLVPLAHPNRR